ncbi:cold-shock protein [Roseateles chitosanitabidus]|jgi:cold shock CspA family protein|uniref:cold-shock protein n=1 Tax=Roseateles chitosanitabidus TaxID=65048 RepID=UPI0009FC3AB7|nr:cold shock domain-containing protein [Roseateles chitosanitabidus]MBO9689756.1 cold shock domain-containing protein [Roseateles chitosanitabidus]
MRFEGTLDSWYAERGHGMVRPEQGGEALFVHVSAFPLDGQSPQEGERVSFEVVSKSDGSKQAVRLQRLSAYKLPSQLRPVRQGSRPPRPIGRRRTSPLVWMVLALLALGVGATVWSPASHALVASREAASARH